ncbi:MAG: carboxymuconolactone decarboxylase family protein [Gemmatimonadaceae bacterium]
MQETSTGTRTSTADHNGRGIRPHAARLDFARVAPDAYRAQAGLEAYLRTCGLEESLLELVKLRASLINGCARCVDMHTKDARHAGETEQRLYAVSVWRETPFFTPRERAALAWTEAVTEVARTGVPDDVYAEARSQFDEEELVALTMAVVTINGWNRLAISFRSPVGDYVAGARGGAAASPRGPRPAP